MDKSNQDISENGQKELSDESECKNENEEILNFQSKFYVLLENQNEISSPDETENVNLNIKLKNPKKKKKLKIKLPKKSPDNELDELVKLIQSKNKLKRELENEEFEENSNKYKNEENILDKLLNINLNVLLSNINIVSLNNSSRPSFEE
uniref:Uncharacterized protein n=1 Tax=Meloidogyne hapla TaxID=6305 RepID=A0A1I8AZ19_MELHA